MASAADRLFSPATPWRGPPSSSKSVAAWEEAGARPSRDDPRHGSPSRRAAATSSWASSTWITHTRRETPRRFAVSEASTTLLLGDSRASAPARRHRTRGHPAGGLRVAAARSPPGGRASPLHLPLAPPGRPRPPRRSGCPRCTACRNALSVYLLGAASWPAQQRRGCRWSPAVAQAVVVHRPAPTTRSLRWTKARRRHVGTFSGLRASWSTLRWSAKEGENEHGALARASPSRHVRRRPSSRKSRSGR